MALSRPLLWPLSLAAFSVLALASPALPRSFTVTNQTGTPHVFDGSGYPVAQGDATDGSGAAFNLPALIWIAVSLLVGVPMACAGIRGWRLTTAVGLGVASAVLTWAAVINSVNASGLADIFLTAIILVFFAFGCALGAFEFARLGGITAIGLAGGVAFGIRIVLLRAGLLVPLYAANWVVVAVCGAAGGLALIWFQRYGLLFGCASIGTFLVALGVDLVLQKQDGMSLGLRFLFDRNDSHVEFLLAHQYTAPLSTRIVLIASLALTPILAVVQHRVFRAPFTRRPVESDDALAIDFPSDGSMQPPKRSTFFVSLWDGARREPDKVNRFSV
ncbi:hypothetical protein GGX14DRAFT_666096 [Mycena pura]|uniref:TM7S3/TM198-like domain-containing protein n=1 Tax=Mycena pura TaxID=153505 RepID=A0AAD6YA20_9AGAR|nr:hypothetical protein GGX14DRAFT_666096 [Mycena pura]